MTPFRRFVLIGRDTATATSAITNLHRCLSKIEERAQKLQPVEDERLQNQTRLLQGALEQAKLNLGKSLGYLDLAVEIVNGEQKQRLRAALNKRREDRERTEKR